MRSDKLNSISGKTGEGVDALISRISQALKKKSASVGVATRLRHKEAMTMALQSLTDAQRVLENGPDFYDIAAEELRSAIRALEMLVGRVGVENLLDEIFSSFCLGK